MKTIKLLLAFVMSFSVCYAQDMTVEKNIKCELKTLMNIFNDLVKDNYYDWGLYKNVKGLKRISDFKDGRISPFAVEFKGVLLMDNKPACINVFGEVQESHVRLEGARVGPSTVILERWVGTIYDRDNDMYTKYLVKIGCKQIKEEHYQCTWYRLFQYKSIYVFLYAAGGGNAGDDVSLYLCSDNDGVLNVKRYFDNENRN